MALQPPPLPERLPCWVRAVYSWGGENTRDLGFVEGDLIECLNTGDGSWWNGRLWRDRRVFGSFPSNFVEVLPPDFRPTSRTASPNPSPSQTPHGSPSKAQRGFRKPFEAYTKAPHYTTAKQPEVFRDQETPQLRPRENSIQSAAFSRGVSPAPQQSPTRFGGGHVRGGSRAPSPSPGMEYGGRVGGAGAGGGGGGDSGGNSRAPSPNPYALHDPFTTAPRSPAPMATRSPAPVTMSPDPMSRSPALMAMSSPAQRGRSPIPPMARSPGPMPRSPGPQIPRSPGPPSHHHHHHHHHHHMSSHRDRSPAPPGGVSPARGVSPRPPRDVSPAPSVFKPYRPPTAMADDAAPPPPPHRHVDRNNSMTSYDEQYDLSRHASNTSYDTRQQQQQRGGADSGYLTPRMTSPCPPSPGGSHMTPSPLREAMDGVIEQLDALGMSRPNEDPDPASIDPWSPDCFDMIGHKRRTRTAPARPHTAALSSMQDEGYETWSGTAPSQQQQEPDPPYERNRARPGHTRHLSNYVDRMQTRVTRMHERTDTSLSLPPPQPYHSPSPNPQYHHHHHHHHHPSLTTTPSPQPSPNPFSRPKSSLAGGLDPLAEQKLRHRKSAYDIGRSVLSRTFTTKTNATSSTTTTNSSGRSLMSGASAGAFSATSAGSFARRLDRGPSAMGFRDDSDRPETPFTGVTYHSSHASGPITQQQQGGMRPKSQTGWHNQPHNDETEAGMGGLVHPKAPKRNIFKKIFDSARTGVANGRSSILLGGGGGGGGGGGSSGRETPNGGGSAGGDTSPPKWMSPSARSLHQGGAGGGFGGGHNFASSAPRESVHFGGNPNMGVDLVQMRRDVNRSNSLSQIERLERRDRCQMLDYPVMNPIDELYGALQGDEGVDGMPVMQSINYAAIQFSQVDKNTRFVAQLPPTTTAISLATTYVCRPYRSDVQRLRAIFTWVSEMIHWEDDYEGQGQEVDTRHVLQSKRACAEEYAVLVMEMCAAIGVQCELVRGYLKTPGETVESGIAPRPNHWWNAVAVDGEWRMMDCCLASPSNPQRLLFSSASSSMADFWWFLTRPSELCWTHIPEHPSQQHMCPPLHHDILLNLPCACPPYFRNGLEMVDFNSSLVRIEDLEMVHIKFNVPDDIEIAAEVEVRAFSRDDEGDAYDGDTIRKRALAQAEWFNGVKRYTVKALLPGDEGHGTLKIYAGKRGLMHSIKDIPHPLAFALPIIHTGDNPPYEFVMRHPTPHAQRHDIYVVQPQCQRLALNHSCVFVIRQHPSSLVASVPENNASTPNIGNHRAASPLPFIRPSSAMSMTAVSTSSGSNPSTASGVGVNGKKPAKLAIQTPGGKILRLMRKEDRRGNSGMRGIGPDEEVSDGGTWETIIKCSERGTWRGLVLADRTSRWCVFAEWVCI